MKSAAGHDGRAASGNANLLALRGTAALTVAVFHSLMWLRVGGDEKLLVLPVWEASTLQGVAVRSLLAAFNGAMAVDIFFVLSGFVLSGAMPERRISARVIMAFYVRRLLRLWPAYAVSLMLVLAGLRLRGDFRVWPQAASWMVQFYRSPMDIADSAANFLLLDTRLNPVAWSLRIEIVMSACLPLLLLAARHLGGILALLQIVAGFVVALFCRYDDAGHFFYLFMLGVYGGVFRADLEAAMLRWGIGRRALVLLCIAALGVPGFLTLEHHPLADLPMGIGALAVIFILTGEQSTGTSATRSVLRAVLLRYGVLSYSFYLCHFIVLYLVAWTVSARAPQAVLNEWPLPVMLGALAAALGPATLLAHAVHRTIERPWMRVGHRAACAIAGDWGPGGINDAAAAARAGRPH